MFSFPEAAASKQRYCSDSGNLLVKLVQNRHKKYQKPDFCAGSGAGVTAAQSWIAAPREGLGAETRRRRPGDQGTPVSAEQFPGGSSCTSDLWHWVVLVQGCCTSLLAVEVFAVLPLCLFFEYVAAWPSLPSW